MVRQSASGSATSWCAEDGLTLLFFAAPTDLMQIRSRNTLGYQRRLPCTSVKDAVDRQQWRLVSSIGSDSRARHVHNWQCRCQRLPMCRWRARKEHELKHKRQCAQPAESACIQCACVAISTDALLFCFRNCCSAMLLPQTGLTAMCYIVSGGCGCQILVHAVQHAMERVTVMSGHVTVWHATQFHLGK